MVAFFGISNPVLNKRTLAKMNMQRRSRDSALYIRLPTIISIGNDLLYQNRNAILFVPRASEIPLLVRR